MEDLPYEIVSHILEMNELSPIELYKYKNISPSMYRRYIESLPTWILDPESWITAIVNNDIFLYTDLQRLMEEGNTLIDVDIEYDEGMREELVYETYLSIYKDLKHIGLSIDRMVDVMYEYQSFSTFSIAMSNMSFRDELRYIITSHRSESIDVGIIVYLALPHRETLYSLIFMFKDDYEVIENILILSLYHGTKNVEVVIEILLEQGIYFPSYSIDRVLYEVHSGEYPINIDYVDQMLREYAYTEYLE